MRDLASEQLTNQKIEVMKAYVEGKQIQYRPSAGGRWSDIERPAWDWVANEYRIKPEPRQFTLYLVGTCVYLQPPGWEHEKIRVQEIEN